MQTTDWIVIAGGLTAVVWVNWYFFLAERATATAFALSGGGAGAAADGADGVGGEYQVPQVSVVVKGGYSPAAIRVRAGQPVRLVFDRQETSGCSEEVVFPDFGIKRFLPAFQQTTVEVTPPAPGRYEFTCGMGMLRGALIAEV